MVAKFYQFPVNAQTAARTEKIVIEETAAQCFARAVALEYELDDWEQAIAAYDKCLQLDPEHFEAAIQLGVLLADLDCLDEARAKFELAIKLRPDQVTAHYNYAGACGELRDFDEAIKSYRWILQRMPDDIDVLYNLAMIYDASKQYIFACRYYRKFLSKGLKSDHYGIADARQRVTELARYDLAIVRPRRADKARRKKMLG